GLPLVATGDVHYLDAGDAYSHEALLCIQSGDTLKNPDHWRFDTNEFYFKTPEEMGRDFPELEHALARTLEIADRCNVELELGRILLPTFPVPEGRDAFDYLVELCEKGLVRRYGKTTPELTDRLRFELKTIREMGFADYFLIVWDFIRFAKSNGVSVGPGRDIPYGVVDRIAKLVPEGPGQTLEHSLRSGAELRQAVDSDEVAKEIVDLAKPLEGLTRADSIHAAGVVIGAQPLIEVVPL